MGITERCTFLLQLDLIEWHKKQSYVFISQIGFMTGNVCKCKMSDCFLVPLYQTPLYQESTVVLLLFAPPNPTFTLSYFR